MSNDSAVTVIEQPAEGGVVEWNLDSFPEASFNRLLPTQTLNLPTDLLRPVVQIVKLNPDPNGGDVYATKDMPNGHSAPTRVGLRKLATAAGISFIDERRVDDGRDPDVIEVTCIAEMLLPTGLRITATGTKRIDLNAQVWRSPEHRGKYKSFFQEHVASRAQNRAIRALLSLRGSYPAQIYERPFAVVSFAPNMNHPEVRSRMLDAMAGASAQLYGPAAAKQLDPGKTINVTPAPEEDPAPATPPALPGESLAKAAPADDTPSWAKAEPAAAGPKPLTELLGDSAASSEMTGAIKPAQEKALQKITGALDWSTETLPVIVAAFGEPAARSLSAGQAAAIITVANSFDTPDDFVAAWKEAAVEVAA